MHVHVECGRAVGSPGRIKSFAMFVWCFDSIRAAVDAVHCAFLDGDQVMCNCVSDSWRG
jgi:hypothetical protein